MAAPSYNSDVVTINTADGTDGTNASGGWSETTGHAVGAAPIYDGDTTIQGTTAVSKQTGNNATGVEAGFVFSGTDIRTGSWSDGTSVVLFWYNMLYPAALESYTFSGVPDGESVSVTGGMYVGIGSAEGNQNYFNIGGNDKYTGPYGGWLNVAIDPVNATPGYVDGSPGTAFSQFSILPNLKQSIRRGQTMALDVIRWAPRGSLTITGGTTPDSPATFARLAEYNDKNSSTADSEFTLKDGGFHRLGLFQNAEGFYLWKGLLEIGGASAGRITDANANIVIDDQPNVYSSFTEFEVASNGEANLSSCSFIARGTSTRGNFTLTGTVMFEACSFNGIGSTTCSANTDIQGSTYVSPDQITLVQGSIFKTNSITNSIVTTATGGSIVTPIGNMGNVTGNTFTSDGSNHAIEITGTATNINLTDTAFINYTTGSTGNGVENTGAANNEAIFVNISSGTVEINVDNSTVPSVRSAGATVNVVSGQATLTVTNVVSGSDVVIYSQGTTTKLQDDQDISGTSSAYTYTYSAGTFVDVKVYRDAYVPFFVYGFELGSTNASLPVAQQLDRNYVP